MSFSAVEQAIADIRAAKLVIVADDERRVLGSDTLLVLDRRLCLPES